MSDVRSSLPSPDAATLPPAEPPTAPLHLLLWQTWSGRYAVRGETAQADCVLGLAFGLVRDGLQIRPGASNIGLAQLARKHFARLPLILQGEVADAYGEPLPGIPLFRIDQHRQAGKYLDTSEVAAQALEIMRQQGWRSAVLLAQAHHVPRVALVCQRLGLQTVVPPGLGEVGFCPNSSQWWTRGRLRWFVRECATMIYFRYWKKCM
jgi:uncharacterized SAM-binding protein YcdF (DUF218 family)